MGVQSLFCVSLCCSHLAFSSHFVSVHEVWIQLQLGRNLVLFYRRDEMSMWKYLDLDHKLNNNMAPI